KTLVAPDSAQVLHWIKKDDWNDYKVHAEDGRIRLFINGHQTVDYRESDPAIPQFGLIGFQIHGGGKAQVAIKDGFIEELNQNRSIKGRLPPKPIFTTPDCYESPPPDDPCWPSFFRVYCKRPRH